MPPTKKTDEGGADQVQSATDDAAEKGYIGSVPDEKSNKAYSLQTGPDSPTTVSDDRTRISQPTGGDR